MSGLCGQSTPIIYYETDLFSNNIGWNISLIAVILGDPLYLNFS